MKATALLLAFSFLFNEVLFAHLPAQSLWDARRSAIATSSEPTQLSRLMDASAPALPTASALEASRLLPDRAGAANEFLPLLPPSLVTVKEISLNHDSSRPLAGRRVLVLQDVHLNLEAQKNIAALLTTLIDNGQAGVVAVEGAVGPFDLRRFRNVQDKSVAVDVADAFLAANKIGGPSYAGITAKAEPPLFIGVDDAEHYESNVGAYLDGHRLHDAAARALDAESRDLAARKRAAFTPELAALDNSASACDRGDKSLGDHLEFLKSIGALSALDKSDAENADRFLEAWKIETTLDFARAERERRAALEALVRKMTPAEIDGVIALSLAYRGGSVSFGDFHRAIASTLERHGVSLGKLPAFQSYLNYVLLSDGIGPDSLFGAVRRAEDGAFARAAKTPEQAAIVAESRQLALERKLVSFSMTPPEWDEYQRTVPGASFQSPTEGETRHQALARRDLKPFEDFYREAHVRSDRMTANVASAMSSSDKSKVAVLVVGGFHAPDMASRLHELGASVAVVSPKLTKIDGEATAYLSIFSRERTPLEKLFAGEKLYVYPAQVNLAATGARTAAPNAEFAA
ncbi:MAG: hypothetical protein JO102_06490, partial [Elusimicrobia bacterium]|nr:hypothetical protein [Elusimicrobiota bacterium]